MINNESLIDYLVEYHATRDYFECHEIMEECWKSVPESEYAMLWVAFIQVAVGQYHDRRCNVNGAVKMYQSALSKLKMFIDKVNEIDLAKLYLDIDCRLQQMNESFKDFNFEITDEQLLAKCKALTTQKGLVWGISSEIVSIDIIDRHKLRDRSDVIAEREASLMKKYTERG